MPGRYFNYSDDRGPFDEGGRRHGRKLSDRDDAGRICGRVRDSPRRWALRPRSPRLGHAHASPPLLLLSTLALEGSDAAAAEGGSRPGLLVRYADLLLLALALPIFIAAGWPLLGYARRRGGLDRPAC